MALTLGTSVKPEIIFAPKLLGRGIREMREFLNLSVRELSRSSGVSHSQILRIESGEFDCFMSSFVKLCGAMGLPVAEFIERCITPEYGLFAMALDAELKGAKVGEQALLNALKDLVFGGAVTLSYLIHSSNPVACVGELFIPTESLQKRFHGIALKLMERPPDAGQRLVILRGLQQKPAGTLSQFYGFPSRSEWAEHLDLMKSATGKELLPWHPSRTFPSLLTARPWITLGHNSEKQNLTEAASGEINAEVKSPLANLLKRLNEQTSEPGKKSELADYLGAPLASVSRWLSGDREPGGEITLKMLYWVERQERK